MDRSWRLLVWQGGQGGLEDVVALLDQVELGEVEPAAVARVGRPGVEVAAVRQVVEDQAGQDAGHQRVAVAVPLQVVLDEPGARRERRRRAAGPRRPPGAVRARLSCRTPGMGWPAWLSRMRGTSREVIRIFDGSRAGQGAKQFVVPGADGGGGIAAADLVAEAGLLVGKLRGVVPLVGDQDAFQAVQDQEPGPGLQLPQQEPAQLGLPLQLEVRSAAGRSCRRGRGGRSRS